MQPKRPSDVCVHCGSGNVQVHANVYCRVILCHDCGRLEEIHEAQRVGTPVHVETLRSPARFRRRNL